MADRAPLLGVEAGQQRFDADGPVSSEAFPGTAQTGICSRRAGSRSLVLWLGRGMPLGSPARDISRVTTCGFPVRRWRCRARFGRAGSVSDVETTRERQTLRRTARHRPTAGIGAAGFAGRLGLAAPPGAGCLGPTGRLAGGSTGRGGLGRASRCRSRLGDSNLHRLGFLGTKSRLRLAVEYGLRVHTCTGPRVEARDHEASLLASRIASAKLWLPPCHRRG